MSARVFKPITLETQKLHKPEPVRSHLRSGIARVRRSLFGPINHAETQRFLEEELAKESRNSADKWQFNFAIGKPFEVPNEVRFVWEPVKPHKEVITYAPVRRSVVVEADNEACYPRHLDVRKDDAELEMETATTGPAIPATNTAESSSSTPSGKVSTPVAKNTLQSRMTDFMPILVRKRSADGAFLNKKSSSPAASSSGPSKLKISRSSNKLGS